jgi:hypothetical protein
MQIPAKMRALIWPSLHDFAAETSEIDQSTIHAAFDKLSCYHLSHTGARPSLSFCPMFPERQGRRFETAESGKHIERQAVLNVDISLRSFHINGSICRDWLRAFLFPLFFFFLAVLLDNLLS